MPWSRETDASPTGRRGKFRDLLSNELWWRDHYLDLEAHGYRLRSRYHPDWRPSWKRSEKDFHAEDGQPIILGAVLEKALDAKRIEDGNDVILKKVLSPHEILITQLFSSPGLKGEPENHSVPLLDLVDLSQTSPDGGKLIVMPFLRPFKNARFRTHGEFVAFFTQISEGLKFMHERKVVYGDCTVNNIMFDPSGMYPEGYYPIQPSWSRDSKGRSKRYPSRDALDDPLRGGVKDAPEHGRGGRCNPFRTDIYYLGDLVREHFMQKYNGFEFMSELVDAMTDENPAVRPTIEEVVKRFAVICGSLNTDELRSPITSKNTPMLFTMFRYTTQLTRTLLRVIQRRRAIPMPS